MNKQTAGVLVSGFLTVCITYAMRYGYGMLLPYMLPELGITKTQGGVIYSSYFVAYTLFSPVLGALSDRGNMRLILTAFTVLMGAGALMMAFATSVLSASIFFIMVGIGHSACWAPVVAMVQKSVSDKRRGMALAWTSMGGSIGVAVWSALIPVLVGNFHWQSGWVAIGIFSMAVAIVNFCLVQDPPVLKSIVEGERAGRENSSGPGRKNSISVMQEYRGLLGQTALWWIGLSYLLVGFTVLVPYTFLVTYGTEHLGLNYAVATSFIGTIAIAGMVGKMVIVPLSDTLGRTKMMIVSNVLMGLGCLGMAYLRSTEALYACSAMFGLGFGGVWAVYAAAAPDFLAKELSGSVIGLWTLFLGVGSILGPIVCGWAIDYSRSYTWTFNMGMISAALSILFVLPVLGMSRCKTQGHLKT